MNSQYATWWQDWSPTTAGYYWMLCESQSDLPVPVEVAVTQLYNPERTFTVVRMIGVEEEIPITDFAGALWSGPITI